ncbi:MAG: sulfatase-like hydrolase/transferase [Deltaproteobacteria bacterium]|nr:sulfatase-like hydrolase/transferase [Deltaproteobacteria bacterium]
MKTVCVAATTMGVLHGTAVSRSKEKKRKPNVVILFIDDLGYADIGCFGNTRIPTPHIDSLAEHGVKCTTSYITNPPCCPSRNCMVTGMYSQRFGQSGMARGLAIPDDHPTIAEFLRDDGYVTGHVGKWDIGSPEQGPHVRGFTQVARYAPPENAYKLIKEDGTEIYRTDLDGDYMAEFVERNWEKPFFLYFSPFAIHGPIKGVPKKYRDRVKGGDETDGAIAAVDDAVGKLLAMLKKYSLEKDTLIFFTGDNGLSGTERGRAAPYRGGKGKGTQLEGWVRTPAIVSWPGHIAEGKVFDGMMCTFDFYATAAAASGKRLPERCDGKNLLPYLRGQKTGDVHEEVYWYNADPTDAKRRRLSAMRWKQWRLVKYPDGWKLFDLKADPQELKDMGDKYPDVLKSMQERHALWASKLPPLVESGPGGKPLTPPTGWGWVIDGNVKESEERSKANVRKKHSVLHSVRKNNHVKINKTSICKTYNCCWGCVYDWFSQSP